MTDSIIGLWKIDPKDTVARAEYGDILMEFKKNGELVYTYHKMIRSRKFSWTTKLRDTY